MHLCEKNTHLKLQSSTWLSHCLGVCFNLSIHTFDLQNMHLNKVKYIYSEYR